MGSDERGFTVAQTVIYITKSERQKKKTETEKGKRKTLCFVFYFFIFSDRKPFKMRVLKVELSLRDSAMSFPPSHPVSIRFI